MKTRIYLRVAKNPSGRTKAKVQAGAKPSSVPLTDSSGYELPTVAFAIDVDLPDAAFKQAEQVIAELTIPEGQYRVAADVRLAGELTTEGEQHDEG